MALVLFMLSRILKKSFRETHSEVFFHLIFLHVKTEVMINFEAMKRKMDDQLNTSLLR